MNTKKAAIGGPNLPLLQAEKKKPGFQQWMREAKVRQWLQLTEAQQVAKTLMNIVWASPKTVPASFGTIFERCLHPDPRCRPSFHCLSVSDAIIDG